MLAAMRRASSLLSSFCFSMQAASAKVDSVLAGMTNADAKVAALFRSRRYETTAAVLDVDYGD